MSLMLCFFIDVDVVVVVVVADVFLVRWYNFPTLVGF